MCDKTRNKQQFVFVESFPAGSAHNTSATVAANLTAAVLLYAGVFCYISLPNTRDYAAMADQTTKSPALGNNRVGFVTVKLPKSCRRPPGYADKRIPYTDEPNEAFPS